MVGLVLVSHSRKLAEGAAELAREMGGPDVKLETAGGLEAPGHPVGTDAALVLRAIERAWSEDGVLVLMDLGSAVLSAEMAVEMLPPERRAKVLLCEGPFVEGAVAAAVTAKLGAPLEQVAAEARGGLAPKVEHLAGGPPGGAVPAAPAAPAAFDLAAARSLRLVVRNPHGLHARPAARFVQTASAFDADVRVANLSAGRGPVTARSLNAVATLGVGKGDEIEVLAAGPEAERALAAIRELAERGFDEELEPEIPAPRPEAPRRARRGAAGHPGLPRHRPRSGPAVPPAHAGGPGTPARRPRDRAARPRGGARSDGGGHRGPAHGGRRAGRRVPGRDLRRAPAVPA